jgi:hypothetical protein
MRWENSGVNVHFSKPCLAPLSDHRSRHHDVAFLASSQPHHDSETWEHRLSCKSWEIDDCLTRAMLRPILSRVEVFVIILYTHDVVKVSGLYTCRYDTLSNQVPLFRVSTWRGTDLPTANLQQPLFARTRGVSSITRMLTA